MRQRIYEIIEVSREGDKHSHMYDCFMLFLIITSLVPLAFKDTNTVFAWLENIASAIFIADYALRWATADLKLGRQGPITFLMYPFTAWALIDLVSILPTLGVLHSGFRLFRSFRMVRAMRVLRVFKALRYSHSLVLIARVIHRSRHALLAVGMMAVSYILISALVVFNVEPSSFNTFFDAVYWATVSLTTVGYGDLYPVTTVGRCVAMLSAFFGIAIVALPASIITAGYMGAVLKEYEKECESENKE